MNRSCTTWGFTNKKFFYSFLIYLFKNCANLSSNKQHLQFVLPVMTSLIFLCNFTFWEIENTTITIDFPKLVRKYKYKNLNKYPYIMSKEFNSNFILTAFIKQHQTKPTSLAITIHNSSRKCDTDVAM